MAEPAQLDEGSWDGLFDFLDPDRRHSAGPDRDREARAAYQEVTRRLACFFAGRGCHDADDLAAETILRVAARCRDVDVTAFAERTGYFFGVARNVHHEWLRHSAKDAVLREESGREMRRVPPLDAQARRDREVVHACLDKCLGLLTQRARQLIVRYYSEERSAKIADHRQLASEFGKSVNALRIEVHRIRKVLRECVLECAHPGSTEPAA